MRQRSVAYEQAVYGSFPFWDRGYGILAHSAGCRPEWLTAMKAACQCYGERPKDGPEPGGFFARPLEDGTHLIVGVFDGGSDDRGRLGALVFHAIFISARSYRKVGYQPFSFATALKGDWSRDQVDAVLPAETLLIDRPAPSSLRFEGLAEEVGKAMARGKRVVVAADEPINDLAREVWSTLKDRIKRRASVATFAYDDGLGFDLSAIPLRRVALLGSTSDSNRMDVSLEERTLEIDSPRNEANDRTGPRSERRHGPAGLFTRWFRRQPLGRA